MISVNLVPQLEQIRAESDNAYNLQNNAPATQTTPSNPHNHECMEDDVYIPKGRSLAHHHIQVKRWIRDTLKRTMTGRTANWTMMGADASQFSSMSLELHVPDQTIKQ